MYIEHFVEHPRHIEFQILADEHGNVIHLGERDCSMQRNHQKMIWRSPRRRHSPRSFAADMGEAAVRAAKAAGYTNAGTVEFLLDQDAAVLFHGDEHPYPGGASGDGDGNRTGSDQGADPDRCRPAA